MNLEDEIVNQMGKEISEEIDFEILIGMLCEMGWHRVMLPPFKSNEQAVDISYWCEENVYNPYHHRGRLYVFENDGDAINFTLKWV